MFRECENQTKNHFSFRPSSSMAVVLWQPRENILSNQLPLAIKELTDSEAEDFNIQHCNENSNSVPNPTVTFPIEDSSRLKRCGKAASASEDYNQSFLRFEELPDEGENYDENANMELG